MASEEHGRNHYETLGVRPGATPDEVKRAYRRKVLALHPDAARDPDGPPADPEAFKRVRLAYEMLSDPAERLRYDAANGLGRRPSGAYHRSFSRLFDSLFSGLHTAVRSTAEYSANLEARTDEHRRAS
jgi:curved DNA-binding protein CbpA